ncbi:hypothetical protein OOZ15_11855 [Galbibacter sp. EGI 63066]|uniref:DUF7793 family protein n=1 Tax=Galbibacter sp. EGI 63066 TaxID=2993559 RepID=UPI002248A866|nr:hypothetical protein [Galbibacter sp. EGI 63066]MCX2680638.1 hypothetical protein [Galbibacter sp. EGI 63066]
MKKCIENSYAYISIQGGILFFEYKDQVTIGLQQAIEVVATRIKLQNGIPYPILCDIRGIKNIDKDARRYLSTEGSLLSKAVALISDTPLSHIVSELYVKNNNPPVPTKVFNEMEEGLAYLKSFL